MVVQIDRASKVTKGQVKSGGSVDVEIVVGGHHASIAAQRMPVIGPTEDQ
jgi:hypothetical protein